MIWMLFRKKKKAEEEEGKKKHIGIHFGGGKALLERARAGLDSQWFRSPKFSILKEFEWTTQATGVIDDKSRERAIASTFGSLEGAIEAFAADNNQGGLKEAADMTLTAYVRTGNPTVLDMYVDVCKKTGMTEEEINQKILKAADQSRQIDVAVTLYSRAGDKSKLIGAGNRALSLYLEANDLDTKARSRLFDYVVEAYKSADDKESLTQAGDKALKSQIEGRRLSHEKDWVLDAQKAYEAAEDEKKLAALGNQYVNLYLKEGLEVWLDKAIVAYKKGGVDFASKLGNLADKVEEKGRSGMADTMRRKAGLS